MSNNNIYNGGKVIGAGGMGCIFMPALKCINSKDRYKNGISKVMKNDMAIMEIDILQKAIPIIKTIPNHNKYFYTDDITICKPNKLTNNDKRNMLNKCEDFIDINNNLEDYTMLTMPYGGKDLDFYIRKSDITLDKFNNINKLLIDLLINGIIPMNNRHLYHYDIKVSNILKTGNSLKLIDWGVSFIDNNKDIPEILFQRPIQFNCPLSILFFNNYFLRDYSNFLYSMRNINKETDKYIYNLKTFLIDYYYKIKDKGHEGAVTNILGKVYKTNHRNIYFKKLIDILVEICIKYTNYNNNTFNLYKYYKEIYLKNIDIYGLILCYESFYLSRKIDNKILTNIGILLKKYIPLAHIEPINIDKLVIDLTNLNLISLNKTLKKRNHKNLSRRIKY